MAAAQFNRERAQRLKALADDFERFARRIERGEISN